MLVYLELMKENRVSTMLSLVSFMQFIFLGFGGGFVPEIIKMQPDGTIIFWTSLFSLILGIVILYLYLEVFSKTKY